MRTLGVVMAAAAVLVSAPVNGAAQTDLSGTWILTVSSDQGDQPLEIVIVQDGQDLTATGDGGEIGPVDIIVEATGYSPLVFDAMDMVAPNGVVCLTGISGGSRKLEVPADHLNLEMVLSNKVVFGTVNANRRHFESGVRDLQKSEVRWPGLLSRMITRRLPLTDFARTLERSAGHIKSVVEIA